MSDTVIAASLTLDSQQATQSVGTFRTQLRNASQSLAEIQAQFGATSEQAVNAAKKVAEIRDRIKEAKQVSDIFNPAMKFEALTKTVQVAAGGVTALTGAMALFGNQSEDVQKAILKVQGALALSQGLSTFAEVGRTFALLKVAATEAFTAIKAGIGSTGIGLLVVALGVIVAYWDDIKMAVGGATGEQIKNLEESKKILDIEKQKLDIITSQQNIYKQQGKSQQDILDIENKQLVSTIAAAQKAFDAQKAISNQAIIAAAKGQIAASGPAAGLGFINKLIYGDPKEVALTQQKTLNDAQAFLDKLKDQLAGNQLSIVKTTGEFNQKIISLNHDAAIAGITDQYLVSQIKLKNDYEAQKVQITLDNTNLEQRNELLAATTAKYEAESSALEKANARKLHDDLRKLNFDAYTANITDQSVLQQLQLKFQLENDIRQTTLEIANIKERREKIAALQQTYDDKVAAIRLKNLQDFQTKWSASIATQQAKQDADDLVEIDKVLDKDSELMQKKAENKRQSALLDKEITADHLDQAGQQAAKELTALNDWYATKKALIGYNEAEIAKLNAEYERQKTNITQQENMARLAIISGVLGQAASLFSQASVAGKVLAIAQTTIDTYQSAVSSYKSLAGIPIVGPALGFAAAGIAIAAGLANVKRIASVEIPGASSSAGGGVPSISAPAPLQVTPQVSNTQLPQNQINQIGNSADPVKAFVVESDISGSQERIKRLNRAARLGG